jgi:DNA-binding transcriptional LysR family regulator
MGDSPRPGRSDLDLHIIRVVRAIDDAGSITGAARILGFSQPAVSQSLQRAEARLGVPLVQRLGRSVRLTEAGAIVSAAATPVESALAEASTSLSRLIDGRVGHVAIAGFPSASATIVPTLLSSLRTTNPGISIAYSEAEPPDAIALLQDNAVHAAITCSYPGDGWEEQLQALTGFMALTLFYDEMLLILPDDHPLADERTIDVSDLQDDEWVAGCPRCRGHVVDSCHAAGFEPDIAFETDNFAAVLGLVARGLGVAILPRLALGTAAIPQGAVVRRTSPGSERAIHLVLPVDALRTPAVHATAESLMHIDGAPWKLRRAAVGRAA